jgi:hypothetical protein
VLGKPGDSNLAADQRDSARQRVFLAGRLVYGDADLTLECAIRDLSEVGAKVRLSGPAALPSIVHLIEVRTGQAFECEIAWRRLPDIGLRFLKVHDLVNAPPGELKMLRRIWAEGAAR